MGGDQKRSALVAFMAPCRAGCLRPQGRLRWLAAICSTLLKILVGIPPGNSAPGTTRFSLEVTPVTKRKTTNAREKGTRRHATPPMLVAVMPRRPCWRGCAAVSLSLSASCVGAYLTIKMTKIAWFSKMAIYGLWSDLGRSFRIRLRRTIRAHWDAP